jgi:hypothetical protein
MSKQQTAVQWLVEQLPIRIVNSYQNEIIKVLEMEKEQIINAFEKGGLDGWNLTSAEYYYNETYNTNHE